MLTKVDKALAALIVSGVVPILTYLGLEIPEEVQVTATMALTAFFVWLVPNKVEA